MSDLNTMISLLEKTDKFFEVDSNTYAPERIVIRIREFNFARNKIVTTVIIDFDKDGNLLDIA